MERLLLLREKNQLPDATLGVLYRDSNAICVTLELPWMDNQPKISCIPKGSYQVTRYNSPSKGEDFLLHDVPDRSMIELHVGNTVDNTEGCILVGRVYGILDGKRAVLHSIPTLQTLLAELPDTFMLDIE